jgi:uncharacterized protein YrrD
MDIPINAKVECQNQDCGKTTCVLINPVSQKITHIVVQEKGFLGLERLIPVEEIYETKTDHITLRCSPNKFSTFEPFHTGHYVSGNERYLDYESDNYYLHPYSTPEFEETFRNEPFYEETELIQPGELGIHRGAVIHATDGKVGQVDEFLISPEDDKISHLVLREGHLWGQKLVTIPVSEINRIETDDVHLKLSKLEIEKLPVIPVKRHYL